MQLRRRGEPVDLRHVDVKHREIGTLRQRGGHDARTVRYLGDDLDVVFQVQHGDQHVPQDPHVLRDQDPDHRPSNRFAPTEPNICAAHLQRKRSDLSAHPSHREG
jgi:hypothetical protein